LLAVCAGTFVLAYLCLILPRGADQLAPIWLPNAFGLALLLLSRRSRWTGIAIMSGVGNFLASVAVDSQPLVATILATCNTLEFVSCAILLVRVLGRAPDMSKVGNLCVYALVAAGASLASAGVAVTVLGGSARGWVGFATWAMTDLAGLLIVTPCVVALATERNLWRGLMSRQAWPLAVLLVVVLGTFLQDRYPLTYLVVAALLLVTWRVHIAGAAAGVLATLGIAVACTLLGRGPFAIIDGSLVERILALQVFLAACFYLNIPVAVQSAIARRLKDALSDALAETREAEAKYRLIAERANDIIVHADLTGRIVYISPSCRALGYEPEELIGVSGASLVHPDDLQRYLENTAQLVRDGVVDRVRERQHRFRRKDGGVVWLEGSPTVLADATGKPVQLLNVFRDITERKASEAALAESEVRYRTLADNVTDILVRFGPDGRVRYISPACRSLGLDPAAAIGQPILQIMAPDYAAHSEAMLAALFSGSEVDARTRRVHRLITPDGREVWLEGSPKLVRDDAGNVVEVVSVLRDVTARRNIEAALADSEARFRLFAEHASDLIVQSDPTGRITYMSPSCEMLTGYAVEEILGLTAHHFIHPDDADALSSAFAAQITGRGAAPPVRVEYRIKTKDGRYIWLEARPQAIVDPVSGLVTSVTDVARDITERKVMEEQLRAARAEAEAAVQVKSEFLANMSHELRTPLTSVVGFTELAMEQPELTPLTRTYVARVGDASRALLSTVNDILDFSKLEAGQVTLRPEPVPLERLASSALDLFQPQAGAKDLRLSLESHLPEGLTLMLDPDRVRQVLLNLIGNAVKFTETGGVTLSLAYDEAAGTLIVAVRDTGGGVAEDRLDRLFKRFSQVDGTRTRSHGGTGLGLAICKGIVEAMGGSIAATSTPGEGSCFSFIVPASLTEPAHDGVGEQPLAPVALCGVRVLVVDDHPANRELAGLFLAGVGAEVFEAEDGVQAAELAAQRPYDVILMDLRMPRLDGPNALRLIRSRRGPNAATPILAFTADADPGSLPGMLDLGFQGVVSKPISPAELISAIAEAIAIVDAGPELREAG
jgi:PAS domain S-box-containing protein